MPHEIPCPIWGEDFKAMVQGGSTDIRTGRLVISIDSLISSPRAGGAYRLNEYAGTVSQRLQSISTDAKARLTTWLVDQRRQGTSEPVITWELAHSFGLTEDRASLSVSKRAERLLIYLANETKTAGDLIEVHNRFREALAWSESTELHEIYFLLRFLRNRGLIEEYNPMAGPGDPCFSIVTVQGFGFIEEITSNPDSTQAFVAMWFSENMNEAFCKGIKPAIEETGFKALRIDLKPDVKKIDDEIFAEIRRSRFLVADMTQGDEGARGGVYFEAGLAEGLGLQVLYSCHKDCVDDLAFDTRQFYHIVWDTPDELREQLAMRIRARIGEGPLRGVSDQERSQT